MAMVHGYYTLAVTKSEDRQRLDDSQRLILNRDYSTHEEANRARVIRQKEWDMQLTVNHPVRPGN